MKKGIALSTIAYFILAIATIALIVGLIGNKIYPSMKNTFCNIYQGVRGILPLPSAWKPDVPLYCQKEREVYLETIEIASTNPDRVAFEIAAYCLACWEKTAKVNLGQSVVCYELVIGSVSGEVTQDMVIGKIEESGQTIDLSWKVGIINGPKSIGISYNSNERKIEVS